MVRTRDVDGREADMFIMYGHDVITDGKYSPPAWNGVPVRPSRSADREMARLRIYLDDVCRILDEGYDCPRSRRSHDTCERCLRMKDRIVRVVAVRSVTAWNGEPVWLVTHVGEVHGK